MSSLLVYCAPSLARCAGSRLRVKSVPKMAGSMADQSSWVMPCRMATPSRVHVEHRIVVEEPAVEVAHRVLAKDIALGHRLEKLAHLAVEERRVAPPFSTSA
jgi:hypothetical protein